MIYFNKLIDICINRQERKVVDNYDVCSNHVYVRTLYDRYRYENQSVKGRFFLFSRNF